MVMMIVIYDDDDDDDDDNDDDECIRMVVLLLHAGNSDGNGDPFPMVVQIQRAYRLLTQTQGYPFPDTL